MLILNIFFDELFHFQQRNRARIQNVAKNEISIGEYKKTDFKATEDYD